MLFRIRQGGGSHVQDGKMYAAGDIIKTDIDLIAKFSGNRKFERIVGNDEDFEDGGTPEPTRSGVKTFETATAVKEKAVKKESKYGKDVTSEFSVAEDCGVKVFASAENWYTVCDAEDNEVLNEKKLRRKDVVSFITDDIVDEEEDEEEDED